MGRSVNLVSPAQPTSVWQFSLKSGQVAICRSPQQRLRGCHPAAHLLTNRRLGPEQRTTLT